MNSWKEFANWFKVFIGIEMLVLYVVLFDRAVWDIVIICAAQYAVFLPIDASVFVKAIRGVK